MKAFWVASHLIREAFARKWFLGLGIAMTLVLLGLMSGLQLEIIDGALAASRFFGSSLNTDIQSASVALRPVYRATGYLTYYGSILFGINACADFAPKLLAAGRVEHLISQPIRRWELLLGTFIGVVFIMSLCIVYGAGGFTLILGFKTKLWSFGLLGAGATACMSFATIYSLMLILSITASSTALAALAGWVFLIGGVLASSRNNIAQNIDGVIATTLFESLTAFLPRFATIADQASLIAAGQKVSLHDFMIINGSSLIICSALLLVGIFLFEQKDY